MSEIYVMHRHATKKQKLYHTVGKYCAGLNGLTILWLMYCENTGHLNPLFDTLPGWIIFFPLIGIAFGYLLMQWAHFDLWWNVGGLD